MERDFLGVAKEGGRGREMSLKEEAKERGLCSRFTAKDSMVDARPADSPLMGSPQWSFLNKLPLQQFMTVKGGAHEERPRKIGYDQLSSSGFGAISPVDAFDTNRRVSTAAKKSLTLDANGPHIGQGSHFGLPCATYPAQAVGHGASTSHHSQELRVFPVSNSPLSAPLNSNYYKFYGTAASTSPNGLASVKPFGGVPVTTHHGGFLDVGSISAPPRSVSATSAKPIPSAQLTIFYAGSVNVFEDVSLDKAQAIMFLAGNSSVLAGNTQNLMAQVPLTTKPIANGFHSNAMKATCSGLSSPVSGTSQLQLSGGHSGAQSAGGSTNTDEVMAAAKTMSPLACKIQLDPSKSIPLASAAVLAPTVPQARKASLARFLEKRKERLTTVSPYAKPPEDCNGGDHSALDVNVPTSAAE